MVVVSIPLMVSGPRGSCKPCHRTCVGAQVSVLQWVSFPNGLTWSQHDGLAEGLIPHGHHDLSPITCRKILPQEQMVIEWYLVELSYPKSGLRKTLFLGLEEPTRGFSHQAT